MTCAFSALLALGGCPVEPDATPDAAGGWRDALSEGPRLGSDRMSQQDIAAGKLSLLEIRQRGMDFFTTPFNHADGFGDGPMNPAMPTIPGGRPTLQGNGVFLRVNGLDAQSCIECHSVVSNATVPAVFGIGGVGTSVTNAVIKPTLIDVADLGALGLASFNGRFANPPFLFGSGGIEAVAREMTRELQAQRATAAANPGTVVALRTKGVEFGEIVFDGVEFDTAGVVGIEPDLIVRPFGRKGEFATVRAFDIEAVQFHFGMQPVEVFGPDSDNDGDGIANEVTVGELSALHIFNTTLKPPLIELRGEQTQRGFSRFVSIGCADCHVPALTTDSPQLTYSYPEVPADPGANAFYSVDLVRDVGFPASDQGGAVVPMFSDLKRHDMGPGLSESTGTALDPMFITARLWGVADTAPYLHDGRAMTLSKAILMHGGEAQGARDAFAALPEAEQNDLIEFLRSLRTPLDATAALQAE